MNSHETHPSPDLPEDHDHEPVSRASENEPTESVGHPDGLTAIIGEAIAEAGPDGEVPDWGARAMARYLATILGEPGSALNDFAGTAQIDYRRLDAELATLWQEHAETELTSEVINRLGTYLIAARRGTGQSLPPQPNGSQPGRSETLQRLIAEHGPAFEAFLKLPDVTEETAASSFFESYYGSFAALDAVVQHLIDDLDLWQQLEDAGLAHLASPDPDRLLYLARQRWDIIAHHGHFYLFEK